MTAIASIRAQLDVTQAELAKGLNVTQGNVSHYELGQSMPPYIARRLIAYAARLGKTVTFEDVYADVGFVKPEGRKNARAPIRPKIDKRRKPKKSRASRKSALAISRTVNKERPAAAEPADAQPNRREGGERRESDCPMVVLARGEHRQGPRRVSEKAGG